jgi:dolichol-phosphate mannosyltransferase
MVLEFITKYKKVIGFAIVGAIGTGVNIGALYAFTEFLGLFYVLSALLSIELATINNFILNDYIVFGKIKPKMISRWKRCGMYHLLTAAGNVISIILLYLFTEFAHIHYTISMFLAIVLVFIFNYKTNTKSTWKE